MADAHEGADDASYADELTTAARRRIGTVLRGKYRVDALLGVGGMAVVYKATHVRNAAEFAVKLLHPELSIREDVRQRFLREGKAANSVKHPGAVLVVDDEVAEDGAAFLVMELLSGIGVDALWEKCSYRLPARTALALGYQLLDVLAAAHAKGIVHRDIKPANLFLLRDGALKVLDFGIARVRDAATTAGGATGTGTFLGTPAFMPPEQALGRMAEIDGRTDVWAAGATLFTLVAGEYVHPGESAPELLVQAATVHPRSLAAAVPDAPPALVQVVDRALAFDKGSRWATATAMRDALGEAYRATFGERLSRDPLAAIFSEDAGAFSATMRPPPAPSKDASLAAVAPTVQGDLGAIAVAPAQTAAPALATAALPAPPPVDAAPAATAAGVPLSSSGTTAQLVSSGSIPEVGGGSKGGRSGPAIGVATAVLVLVAAASLVGWRATRGDHAVVTSEPAPTTSTPPILATSASPNPSPSPGATPTVADSPTPSAVPVAAASSSARPGASHKPAPTHGPAAAASSAPASRAQPAAPASASPCRMMFDHYDGNYQPIYRQDCH